jgi:hypothetical protein
MGFPVFLALCSILTMNANGEVVSTGDASLQKSRPPVRETKAKAEASGAAPSASAPHAFSPQLPAAVVQPYVSPVYHNGAGETGVKWDSGISSETKKFDTDGEGLCGQGQDLWAAVSRVMSENVIPTHKGYNLGAVGWPKLTGGALKCDFAPGKQSMCTSATAAVLCQHFSDLMRAKAIQLTPEQIAFLNGIQVKAAINGNSFSVAKLIQHLGGQSIFSGQNGGVAAVLAQAQTGDILRIDRNNGTGHSTIFKELNGSQFCYWASNTATKGVGVQCEYLGAISQAVVSRFPSDLEDLGSRIDSMRKSLVGFTSAQANTLGPQSVSWAGTLDCPAEKSASR